MVGHCLIELGLVTSVECGYEHCVMPTREFALAAAKGEYRGRGIATVDHVVSISDGGDDMPLNLQLMHMACNGSKGSRDARKNPEISAKISAKLVERWQRPGYRETTRVALSAAQQRPEVAARKSESMKKTWADPEHRAARAAAISEGLKSNWAQGRPPKKKS